MKKLLAFLLLIPLLSFVPPKRNKVAFKNDIFKGEYSETLEQPLWVEYKVLCPNGTASRTGMDFYTNDSIFTSDSKDYENNVYDKGHLAPAADFSCDKPTLYKTFSYLNCALQNQYLNRGVWRMLEIEERELAKKSEVKVKIVLDFNGKCEVLTSGATVPVGFFKYITVNKTTTTYYFENQRPVSPDPKFYVVKTN